MPRARMPARGRDGAATARERTVARAYHVEGRGAALLLYGEQDHHLRALRTAFGVRAGGREGALRIEGTPTAVAAADTIVARLVERAGRGEATSAEEVALWIRSAEAATRLPGRGPSAAIVEPRTAGQAAYLDAIAQHDLVFALGPAGTGKTYLAVAAGLTALRDGRVRRLVLTRPAVEAGEHLGFLPGDFQAKVNPYLRPLYDALNDFLGPAEVRRHLEHDTFEIAPLAYMRGRTLNDSMVILDEAQNTSITQMKMFLTRLGQRSRAVVTGDPTQVDLPRNTVSGLVHAVRLVGRVPGIAVVRLTRADIVRHTLVQAIVDAYDAESPMRQRPRGARR